jgi:hypothetical protein
MLYVGVDPWDDLVDHFRTISISAPASRITG